ncbi:bursicon-like [Mercenaria mercenaria]|uniref:bursicon-like n=1 Tax=Mercenaria mercenaria TaxID=6596 RepID=UPI00234F7A1B|nr:bursicon-like [Mercenaria mercenaria]
MKRIIHKGECSLYDVISWFAVMLQCVYLTAGDTCARRLILLTIQHQDCIPKVILAPACRGTCSSYSRPSIEFPGQMERFCQCCDADDVRLRRANVLCPVQNAESGRTTFRTIRVNMNVPRTCRCRPCSETPGNVVPAEQELWSQGKRDSNKNMKRRPFGESDIKYLIRQRKPFIIAEDNLLNFTYKEIG